jgi:hypothetical protein
MYSLTPSTLMHSLTHILHNIFTLSLIHYTTHTHTHSLTHSLTHPSPSGPRHLLYPQKTRRF